MAGYGQYNYESSESRALKTIRADSYNKDLAKNIIQLNNHSEYMAQYLRKLQKGVDEANENVVEQISGLISDIFVLFAGGSDTGLEFGDLKYVFQMFGSLFGLTDEDGDFVPFPINLFNAAWHFFSTYIIPVGSFTEVINLIIDNAIAFILDVFGEIPIIGEALQTFAMWILDLRDNILMPIFNVIQEIIEFFTGKSNISELFNVITKSLLSIFSPIKAKNLTGKIDAKNIDRVPIQSLFEGRVNTLDEGTFMAPESIEAGGEFEHDATVAHKAGQGSARCICDGFEHELYSNPMAVGQKTEANLEVQVKYQNVVSTTAPIKLRIATFAEGVEMEVVDLDTIATGGSGGWVELRGEYRIPTEGIDEVRMVLHVSGNATSGTVWFSNASMTKNYVTGIAPIDWIIDLPEALSGIDTFVQFLIDSWMEAIDGIFGDGTPIGDFLDTFFDFVDDVFSGIADAASALFDVRAVIRNIVEAFLGVTSTNPDQARIAVDKVYEEVLDNAKKIQGLQARDAGEKAVGKVIEINFKELPDGPLPSGPNGFNVQYVDVDAGANSVIRIVNGKAQWQKGNNLSRRAIITHNVPTETSSQVLRGTMADPPEDQTDYGRPYFYANGRVSSDAQAVIDGGVSKVWARAWSVGAFFLYRCDIGCTINGVDYVWVSGIPLTWSFDMSMTCGVGNNLRMYQIWSGTKLVYTYEESPSQPGGLSKLSIDTFDAENKRILDMRYRRWGSTADLVRDNSGTTPNSGGSIAACAVADNELPSTIGTNCRLYRTSTSLARIQGGGDNIVNPLPANFWGFVGRASRDFDINTATGTVTIKKEGLYRVKCRIELGIGLNTKPRVVLICNDLPIDWSREWDCSSAEAMVGDFEQYFEAGDIIKIGTTKSGGFVDAMVGDATGTKTYFSLSRIPDQIQTVAA